MIQAGVAALAAGESVAAVAILVLPFILVALLYRSFRRRRRRGVDELP